MVDLAARLAPPRLESYREVGPLFTGLAGDLLHRAFAAILTGRVPAARSEATLKFRNASLKLLDTFRQFLKPRPVRDFLKDLDNV